jgi:hypothetical protein
MTCEFTHADASVSVRDAASFDTAFIRAEKGSSRPGHSRENNCQVLRPSSRTPSSSVFPSRNLSPATVSGPCRNPKLGGDLGGAELQYLAEQEHGPLPRRQYLHRCHQREPHVCPHPRVEPRIGKRL